MLRFIFLFSVLLFSVALANPADDASRNFFRGIISRGLGDHTWINETILSQVNASNFPVQQILKANQILYQDARTNSRNDSLKAMAQITISFSSVLNALFPIVAFSLRFDGIIRLIPPQDRPIFDVLNETFYLYSDNSNLLAILKEESSLQLLLQYGNNEQYFEAGESFESLTQKFRQYTLNLQIDIDLTNLSDIIEENYHADQLFFGLLSGLGEEHALSESLATHINITNFNVHRILAAFNVLSNNSLNFSSNSKDEEKFTENVGEISLYLRNARDLANQYGNSEAQQLLGSAFGLFEKHTLLLQSIKAVLGRSVDVRQDFRAIYTEGEINGNYENAGKVWGFVCKTLNQAKLREPKSKILNDNVKIIKISIGEAIKIERKRHLTGRII